MNRVIRYFLWGLTFPLLIAIALGQKSDKSKKSEDQGASRDPMNSATFNALKWRSIGPAVTGGRISSISVNPHDKSTYFVGVASGGVWMTTNSGNTWDPVFDNEGSYSIGTVTIDTLNPLIVWVGTGENNSQRSVGYGDGVYRSEDGGKSWKNMGLKKSEHIARILIDPRSSNIVYVASQGPLWGPGGDRGLYKSTDAGKTWKNILSISENTGVSDIVMDPRNPDVLYASAYQRRRHEWTLIDGGPESAIYKSTDAGATWNKLHSGLPDVELGRIGLAISQVNPNVLYATVEAAEKGGGIFRSTDAGASWEKRNDFDETAMYYAAIYTDPKDIDRIYVMNTLLMLSTNGGKTLRPLGEKSKHVDNHVIWIEPENTNHYLVGCDGGLYESFDRGQNWIFKNNLPITQFYDVALDNEAPFYNVYGGTQDNASLGGPSRTRNESGIVNSDWFVTTGGDGFQSRVDPVEPYTIYAESQYGGLVRFDRRTGEQIGIQPMSGKREEAFRWNWDSPIIISPHSHTRLYFAANKLFRSDDRGNTWKEISGNLHRPIDRNSLPVMGKVWGPDAVAKNASTSIYGNSTALAESPLKEGFIFVGTDDGVIQITEDGGANWRHMEKFNSVPETTLVSRILPSQHDMNVVYASFDHHRMNDFRPYIIKSTDKGQSWESIKGDLPENGPVLAIAEDPVDPNLLFAGTEFGVFFTNDGGQKWIQLKGGMPVIAVRDLAIQQRENDLVAATFGRGFYILDDYSALRSIKKETFDQDAVIFPIKEALMYIEAQPLGGGKKGTQGESFYNAPNPDYGATFTYYLKEGIKTLKEKRKDSEKEAEKNKQPIKYPTIDELRAEDQEEAPAIFLTITDSMGNVVRKVPGNNAKGIARIAWNLRYPSTELEHRGEENEGGSSDGGALVMPGTYFVSLSKKVNGVVTQLTEPQKFNVVVPGLKMLPDADRAKLLAFQLKVTRLQRAVHGAEQITGDLKTRIDQAKNAIMQTSAPLDSLYKNLLAVEERNNDLIRELNGDQAARSRNENDVPSISERVGNILGDESASTSLPTQTHIDAYNIAGDQFTEVLAELKTLLRVDVAKIESALEAAGAPWTEGRLPDWKKE
jgi:photosystem II stability/assembly factor-like uncharacterized protein